MPWGRLDDSLYDHPKLDLIQADDRLPAIGLWARAISWCNRFLTDGHVPRARVEKLDGTPELAAVLVAAGLFEEDATGYRVHDFLDFNDSREAILERRQKEAERKAAYRANKGQKARPNGTDHGTARSDDDDVPLGVPPSVPAGQGDVSRDVSQRDSRTRESRPDPTRPDPSESITPQPPASGGRPSRANGTSKRQREQAQAAKAEEETKARRWRIQQRYLAYSRGAITEGQRIEMDGRDAPLEEIPDWLTRLTELDVEAWTA